MNQPENKVLDKPQYPVVSEIETHWKQSNHKMVLDISKQLIKLIDNGLKPTHT